MKESVSAHNPASLSGQIVFILRALATLCVMLLAALLMSLFGVLTLFQLRAWYAEGLLKRVGQLILAIWQIDVKLHAAEPFSADQQVVYIANHSSTIDLFVLIALGLPRTRFFLSGHLRRGVLIGIIGYIVRVFWTVPQTYPEQRRKIFQSAERVLRKTGESVFLSPEGARITTGQIGPFNKGSFHLAMALRAPIVPIYIHIPAAIDPGIGLHARPGCVDVYVMPRIETAHWRMQDLIENKEAVRDLYVQWQQMQQQRHPDHE